MGSTTDDIHGRSLIIYDTILKEFHTTRNQLTAVSSGSALVYKYGQDLVVDEYNNIYSIGGYYYSNNGY